MSKHYNIQVNIQEVTTAPVPVSSSYSRGGHTEPEPEAKRYVKDTASLKVTADTEEEAFSKVLRLISAIRPTPAPHVHRASCDDSSGNHVCGK
jgi:hypothetical protein